MIASEVRRLDSLWAYWKTLGGVGVFFLPENVRNARVSVEIGMQTNSNCMKSKNVHNFHIF